ncbi:Hsp70 family protein [Rhodococcus sp. O3]|uniref:Hsp70 family protein n=1 Tax=Rhodococcus sp. O3 TaxID=3404919 RepID=UPI003B6789D6
MTSVLGMSVGASAVRFARRDTERLDGPIFRSHSVTALLERPEEPATGSIETVLTQTGEIDEIQAIGVAYRNEAQADAVQTAMARLDIDNFQLVPEVTAALEMLEASGNLGEHETLVLYDLGSSGLTITVVDRATRFVLSTARSNEISGDLVDRLIYDHHLEQHRLTRPLDTAAHLALAARCRDAKEQLSTSDAVCMPGEGGLLLLSQDSFGSLIDDPVKTSARLTREVIRRSGRTPDAAVLIGGGANIPLVTSVMESWLNIPVIVPAQPELVAADGAALLAQPATDTLTSAVASPTETPAPGQSSHDLETVEFRTVEIRPTTDAADTSDTTAPPSKRLGFLFAGGIVATVAVVGLAIGLLQGSDDDAQPAVTPQNTQAPLATQTVAPQPTTIADATTSPEDAPPVIDNQSVIEDQPRIPAQTRAPATYQSPTQTYTTPQTQESASDDASDPEAPPQPGGLLPSLPQFQLPALPPAPQLPLPELPRRPGF